MAGAQAAFDKITSKSEAAPVQAVAVPDPRRPVAQAVVLKGYGHGNLVLGVIGAILGSAAGAVAWVALSTVTGWHMSYFAIVVGGLVGFGVGQGNGGRGGMGAGMIGAIFALAGILAAQATLTQFALEDARKHTARITDEDAKDHMAWSVYREFESSATPMTKSADGWPAEVLAETSHRWEAMSAPDRQAYMAAMRGEKASTVMKDASLVSYAVAYLWSSGWIGLGCVGVSMATAWRIASRNALVEAKKRGLIQNVAPQVVMPAGSGAAFRGLPSAPPGATGPMKVESSTKPEKGATPVSGLPTPQEISEPARPASLGMLAKARPSAQSDGEQKEAA